MCNAAKRCRLRHPRQKLAAESGVPVPLFDKIRRSLRNLHLKILLATAVHIPLRMDPMTAIAASGLRARMESLDLLSNNIANASTGGYKADREFYSLYVAPEAAANEPSSTMPLIERPWVDHAQGVLHATGNPLDVALSGKGFFTVNGPSGPLYTRNGNFRLATDGKLTSPDGYRCAIHGVSPITLQAARPLDISSDGTITQDGVVAGKLEIVDFTSTAGLSKQGSNYSSYRPGGAPHGSFRDQRGTGPAGSLQYRKRRRRGPPGQCNAPVRDAAEGGVPGCGDE